MEMRTSSTHSARRQMPKGSRKIVTLPELCPAHEIESCNMILEMLGFIKQTAANDPGLPTDLTELGLLPVDRFAQLEIPVSDFQDAEVFQIHRARCNRLLGGGGNR